MIVITTDEIAVRAKSGDNEDISTLWKEVEPFIKWCSQRYYTAIKRERSYQIDLEDMVQAGALALYKAVDYYDPEKGSFLTALKWYHKREIYELCGWQSRHDNETGKYYVKNRNDAMIRCSSIDAPMDLYDGDEPYYFQIVDPYSSRQFEMVERKVFNEQLRKEIVKMLETLPEKDADVIRALYLERMTITSYAEIKGITFQAVSNQKKTAIKHIKCSPAVMELSEFL